MLLEVWDWIVIECTFTDLTYWLRQACRHLCTAAAGYQNAAKLQVDI